MGRGGADRGAFGRTIVLDGQPLTVLGVAPPVFYGNFLSIGVEVFAPLSPVARFDSAGDRTRDRGRPLAAGIRSRGRADPARAASHEVRSDGPAPERVKEKTR